MGAIEGAFMKKTFIYIMSFLLTVVIGFVNNSYADNASIKILTNITNVKETQTDSVWRRHREKLIEDIRLPSDTTDYLYYVQIHMSNFVQLAVETGRADWMIDLMALYLLPYDHLQTVNKYIYYVGGYTQRSIDRQFKMWLSAPENGFDVGKENLGDITQFLYPVTLLMVEATRNPLIKDHPITIEFVDKYLPVVFKDHYLRWIFSKGTSMSGVPGVFELDGWGCRDESGRYFGNHSGQTRINYLKTKEFSKSIFSQRYCDSVWDVDLFMISGSIHILALQSLRPDLFSEEDQADLADLLNYVNSGIELFESRLTSSTIENFQSEQVDAVNWDLGAWQGHPDFAYSGDDDPSFPGYFVEGGPIQRQPTEADNVGNDISHARRLVRFLFTLDRYNTELNLIEPVFLDNIHRGMANQLAYDVFDGNFQDPNFSNYLDGTVGWYRVNYAGRPNFGYPPYDWVLGGRSFLCGGYMFWSRHNSDLIEISTAALNKDRHVLEEGCNSGERVRRGDCYCLLQISASIPVEYYD